MEGEQKMALAVIEKAFRDLRQRSPGRRWANVKLKERANRLHLGVRACAASWLVSPASESWFDAIGADREYVLEAADWKKHATEVYNQLMKRSGERLADSGVLPRHIRLLREGLAKRAA